MTVTIAAGHARIFAATLPVTVPWFVTPDPNAPSFRPTGDVGMCAVGIAAKPIAGPDGNPDWTNIWGARIALTLNDGEPYDARAHGVTGLAFHIDSDVGPAADRRTPGLPAATNTLR